MPQYTSWMAWLIVSSSASATPRSSIQRAVSLSVDRCIASSRDSLVDIGGSSVGSFGPLLAYLRESVRFLPTVSTDAGDAMRARCYERVSGESRSPGEAGL